MVYEAKGQVAVKSGHPSYDEDDLVASVKTQVQALRALAEAGSTKSTPWTSSELEDLLKVWIGSLAKIGSLEWNAGAAIPHNIVNGSWVELPQELSNIRFYYVELDSEPNFWSWLTPTPGTNFTFHIGVDVVA